MITTVRGEIKESEVGVASPHEHIFIDMRKCVTPPENTKSIFYDKITCENRVEVFIDPYGILDNALLDEKEYAIKKMEYFKEWGGQTIVDCTLDEVVEKMCYAQISQRRLKSRLFLMIMVARWHNL